MERVITRVKMDREKKKQNDLFTRNCIPPGVRRLCAPYSKKSLQLFRDSSVETQIGKTSSTKVSVMSDEEIEAMIAQALQSKTSLTITNEKSETNISAERDIPLDEDVESKEQDIPQIEVKIPTWPVEVQSALRPQWVEIKPAQKANASIIDLPFSSSNTDLTPEPQSDSAVNLANEELTNYEILRKEKLTDDRLSFNSNMSYDFVIRNVDSDRHKEAEAEESPPVSPVSFGIDSVLNDCERAEMERVLRKVVSVSLNHLFFEF